MLIGKRWLMPQSWSSIRFGNGKLCGPTCRSKDDIKRPSKKLHQREGKNSFLFKSHPSLLNLFYIHFHLLQESESGDS